MIHKLFGINMTLYILTDWAGLVPVAVVLIWGTVGLVQLIKRRSLMKVEVDILILGVYYIVVVALYVVFEMIPINYRPVLIDGIRETSYPSSTTLLVLSVMPTLAFQADRRLESKPVSRGVGIFSGLFSVFMVVGRLLSGVHWLSDIIGAALLSSGLVLMYRFISNLEVQ